MSKKLHHRAHHSTTQAASRCLRTHQVSKPWVQVDRLDVHDDSSENVCDHCFFFRISSSEFGCSTQLFHWILGWNSNMRILKSPSHMRPKSKWPSNRLGRSSLPLLTKGCRPPEMSLGMPRGTAPCWSETFEECHAEGKGSLSIKTWPEHDQETVCLSKDWHNLDWQLF